MRRDATFLADGSSSEVDWGQREREYGHKATTGIKGWSLAVALPISS
jgi:hypothetical protein